MTSSPLFCPRRFRRLAGPFLAALCHVSSGSALAAEPDAWPVIGRQGVVRLVLVPPAQASDDAAYRRQIARLCEPERTCFLNFYTNSKGAELATPLPDAIAEEATATFRRSMKNGAELLRWSCRLKVPGKECF